VLGLIVGNVFPDAESTHFPLINNFVALTFTVGSITVVAVAISSSSNHPLSTPRKRRLVCAT
jgi:ABC-type transport system involved in cytochrome c biogenesis permease subunit